MISMPIRPAISCPSTLATSRLAKRGSSSCRDDTLIHSVERGTSSRRSRSARAMVAASMTASLSGKISPASSAIGMNIEGGTRPRPGWAQRASASAATGSPVLAS